MKITLVGNPTSLPEVFNQGDTNKQTVMIVKLAVDRNYKSKATNEYGTDYIQVRAFPVSDQQGSFIWNTVQKAIDSKHKVSIEATRQQNIYEKNGETIYDEVNRLDEIHVTGAANTVSAVGRLSRDVHFYNDKVATVTVAVERDYIAKGKSQPDVDHIEVKLFVASDKQSDMYKKHLSKGTLVSVTGALRSSSFVDANGKTVYKEEIEANNINPFLASKPKAADSKTAPVASAAPAKNNSNPFA